LARLPFVNRLVRTVAQRVAEQARSFDGLGDNMTAPSLTEAEGATAVAKITITRALKAKWHAATRKQGGSYEIATVTPASSERRARSLLPWRRAAEARADAELRQQLTLAEEQLAELKTALDDMRAQRDAWQVMAQARIMPAVTPATTRWPWLRAVG
jgi:hypothetical protein